MRRLPALFAAALGACAGSVAAAPIATITVAIGTATPVLLLPAFDPNSGRFGGRFVLCDGSVRVGATSCDGSVLPADSELIIGVTGSVFPEIAGSVSFLDIGSPTSLTVTFGALIPSIPGAATTVIEGSVTVPADRSGGAFTSPLVSGQFIEGGALGPGGTAYPANLGLLGIVPDPLGPKTVSEGPVAGSFDCATLGGCDLIILAMGVNGRGDGTQYELSGRFDLDAAAPAPVPLPAPLALLAAGLGLLGAVARRR